MFVGNDVDVATQAEFHLGAGQAVRLGARRVLGHGRRRRPDPRRQAVARPRRRGRDRAHGGQDERPTLPVRAPGLHGGLRRARRDGGPCAPAGQEGRQDQAVQADGEARPDPAHQLGVVARARAAGQAGEQADRGSRRGAGGRGRLGREPARRRGRDHRRRPRGALRRALRAADLEGHAPAPVQRHPAPGRQARRARRPRRRARRGAADAAGARGGGRAATPARSAPDAALPAQTP